ncbi:hypothetical protein APR50_22690 [Variovorax paradoxus]|jgi:hypothetical protein|uniref:hypothetical protein n=1 Tax=Variovorax TaxID=34072 RepID=UPI0006E54F4E|nr:MULTISPECIES: hypothetical protein [unclassified Variovorax]KPU93160.1 hypothetical protein APR52_25445 [Variovorax paradoxus]KAF1069080.1 MAG: hypothetical protein GAK39_02950 [Variovorax sp.]KPV04269.1 hypothetical protein APR50_22690 [Variovorax paradoxus]KPV10116.1 hypothetical protein APR49_12065 [Variovorax paradoxus]KPV12935.1 hypothetical protein APR51_41275 [Variovorax paradoxus]
MTDKERLDYLQGQVAALKSFCLALMSSHPNPRLLFDRMERFGNQQAGILLGQPTSDALLQGADAMRDQLLAYARELQAAIDKKSEADKA